MSAVRIRGLNEAVNWFDRKSNPAVFDLALMRAINKTAQWTNVQLRREIANSLGVQQKIVKPRFSITKSSTGRLVAQVWFGAYRIPLYKAAGGRVSKRAHGVSTPVRGGTSAYVPGGFVARMPSGESGIFRRTTRKRLPIKEVMLPTDEVGERAFAALANGPLQQRFSTLLDHELRHALR
jgi:hypothetical protein